MKKFLTNLWNKIKSLFGGLPAEFQKAIHIGVTVTEAIKTFVESPAADVITAIIPGKLDDSIKQILRAQIPGILVQMKLAEAVANSNDPEEITAAAIKALQKLDGNIKSAFLHNLSILIAQVAADGKLSWQDGAYVLEWYYQHKYKAA